MHGWHIEQGYETCQKGKLLATCAITISIDRVIYLISYYMRNKNNGAYIFRCPTPSIIREPRREGNPPTTEDYELDATLWLTQGRVCCRLETHKSRPIRKNSERHWGMLPLRRDMWETIHMWGAQQNLLLMPTNRSYIWSMQIEIQNKKNPLHGPAVSSNKGKGVQ